MCEGRAALFAVALLSGTPATGSPEWRLSVTLYQLPTCHRHPDASPLFVCLLTAPISASHPLPSPPRVASLLPSLPRLHFSTPSYIPWLQLAFLNTLLLSVPFSPHLTPYPCFPFLVLVLQLDCVCVCARVRNGVCVCVCMRPRSQWTIALRGWARLWSVGGRSARVPFSIRTKHACGAGRHQLEMQSGPLS